MARVIYEGHSSRDYQRLVQCFLVVDTFPGTRGQRVALQGCIYLNNSDSFAQSHLYHVLVFPWMTGELFMSVLLYLLMESPLAFAEEGLCLGQQLLSSRPPGSSYGRWGIECSMVSLQWWELRPWRGWKQGSPHLPSKFCSSISLDCMSLHLMCPKLSVSPQVMHLQISTSTWSHSWWKEWEREKKNAT